MQQLALTHTAATYAPDGTQLSCSSQCRTGSRYHQTRSDVRSPRRADIIVCGVAAVGVYRRLEIDMPISRKEARGGKAFAMPMLGIALLLVCYFVLADWEDLPKLMSAALASVHWVK